MLSFLKSVLTGVLVSLIFGGLIVLGLSAVMYEHPIKSPEDLKNSTTALLSSLDKLKNLNSRSEKIIDSELNLDEFVDKKDLVEQRKIKKSIEEIQNTLNEAVSSDLENADLKQKEAADNIQLTPEEFAQLKKDMLRLQKQLDRVENNSRLLHLQIKLLEKQNASLKKSIVAFASGKKQNTTENK